MGFIYFAVTCAVLLYVFFEAYVYYFRPRQVRGGLNETIRYHPERKQIIRTERLFNELYRHVRGKAISMLARRAMRLESDEFIYGEIIFPSFYLLLEKTQPQAGEVFYDLGSGSGKAVFAAALSFDFSKVCGIELLPALSRKAQEQKGRCKKLILDHSPAFRDVYSKRLARVEFLNSSFLETDFSDADIVYIAATCLSYWTWAALVEKLAGLKAGSRVIVTTKRIEHRDFALLASGPELMSWGLCTVNIYRKIA